MLKKIIKLEIYLLLIFWFFVGLAGAWVAPFQTCQIAAALGLLLLIFLEFMED